MHRLVNSPADDLRGTADRISAVLLVLDILRQDFANRAHPAALRVLQIRPRAVIAAEPFEGATAVACTPTADRQRKNSQEREWVR